MHMQCPQITTVVCLQRPTTSILRWIMLQASEALESSMQGDLASSCQPPLFNNNQSPLYLYE
uniref:Putative ovule protein n=1 Tax=Solanum chacoense TaxID=4108 RepID=A0A0V0GIX5_SOLCH